MKSTSLGLFLVISTVALVFLGRTKVDAGETEHHRVNDDIAKRYMRFGRSQSSLSQPLFGRNELSPAASFDSGLDYDRYMRGPGSAEDWLPAKHHPRTGHGDDQAPLTSSDGGVDKRYMRFGKRYMRFGRSTGDISSP